MPHYEFFKRKHEGGGTTMAWNFVGRNEEIARIGTACGRHGRALVVTASEPGLGRSSLLNEAVNRIPDGVVRLTGQVGDGELDTLRRLLPGVGQGLPLPAAARAGSRALLTYAAGRPVFVDDAQLTDHASMLVLRELHRRARIRLVFTHLPGRTPDPLDCLCYEPNVDRIRLSPLSRGEVNLAVGSLVPGRVDTASSDALHAASGGNPALLRELAHRGRLALRDGKWRVTTPATTDKPLSSRANARLTEAIGSAWDALDIGRVELLRDLTPELDDRTRRVLATALLLRSRPAECLRLLESAPADPETALLRAIALAFGLRRPNEADLALTAAGGSVGMRAWIAAAGGRTVAAAALLADEPMLSDRVEILFDQAARGLLAMAGDRPWQAIPHMRRAVAAGEAGHVDLPWLAPYLRALLIDALLLGGRIPEATALAADFHAARRSSGWPVAVAISVLAAGPLSTERTGSVEVAR